MVEPSVGRQQRKPIGQRLQLREGVVVRRTCKRLEDYGLGRRYLGTAFVEK
jgi:hypothetical protein